MNMRNVASALSPGEEYKKRIAWSKTLPAPGINDLRIDCDNRPIRWSEYGMLTEYGWEIDHIHPSGLGGPDIPENLRARHWRGNRRSGGLLGALLDS